MKYRELIWYTATHAYNPVLCSMGIERNNVRDREVTHRVHDELRQTPTDKSKGLYIPHNKKPKGELRCRT